MVVRACRAPPVRGQGASNNMKRVHEPNGQVEDLPFDQYQRYRLVADIVRSLRPDQGERLRILDIGGSTALLRQFLPEHDIELVDVLSSKAPGLVLGDGSALPFQDDSFDLVCGFDTLEHVPADRRDRFIAECLRVSSRWIALSGPYADPEVEEAEALVRGMLAGMGVQNKHLEEHATHGLPDRARTEELLTAGGARLATFAHGNLSLWLPAMTLGVYMDVEPTLRDAARDMHRFYNQELYGADHGGRTYRHVVFAALDGAALPEAPPLEPSTSSRVAPARRLIDYVASLGLVERSRATWSAEREQWTRDLELWRGERDELAAANEELASDLEGHRESLTLVTNDLETHRQELERARGDEVKAQDLARELTHELEQLRALRTELESHLAESEAHCQTVEADLQGHRDHVRTLEADLEGHRGMVTEQRRQIEALTTDRDAHQEALNVALTDTQIQSNELAAVQAARFSEREALQAELARVQQELEAQRELEASLRHDVALRDDFIRDLKNTLRSRKANLRRALSVRSSDFRFHSGLLERSGDEESNWRAQEA